MERRTRHGTEEEARLKAALRSEEDNRRREPNRAASQDGERTYRRVVELAQEGILMFDEHLLITFANPRAVQLLGCPAEELLGQEFARFLFPADLPDYYERMHRRAEGEPQRYQRRLRRKDGQAVWAILSATPLLDAQQRFTGCFLMLTDITEQKRTEERLQESEALYRAVVEHSPEGMAVAVEDQLVYLNPAATRLTGLENADSLMGRPILDFVEKEFQQLVSQERQEMLKTGRPMPMLEGKLLRADGTAYDAEGMGVPVVYNQKPAVLYYFHDITDRKRALEALLQSETRYRTLFERAQDAIFVDEGEHFADCNARALEMFGCEREQIIGETPARFSPPRQPDGRPSDEKAHERIAAAYAGHPQFFEWRHRRRDGSEFDAEVTLNRLEVRERPMLLAIVRDITDRKRAEVAVKRNREELERRVRERTADLESFVSGVAHDLRAPLRSIDGYAHILGEICADNLNERARDCLHQLRSAAERMNLFVQACLELAHATHTPLRRETVDLSQAARKIAAELQQHEPARAVEFVTQPGLVTEGDPALLYEVLQNLLGNAWKFTARTAQARIEFGRAAKDGGGAYYVRDNGVGFSMDSARRLFRPLQRLDSAEGFPGTGIGLATVHQIIRRHGGKIWAQATPGAGATFYFTLS